MENRWKEAWAAAVAAFQRKNEEFGTTIVVAVAALIGAWLFASDAVSGTLIVVAATIVGALLWPAFAFVGSALTANSRVVRKEIAALSAKIDTARTPAAKPESSGPPIEHSAVPILAELRAGVRLIVDAKRDGKYTTGVFFETTSWDDLHRELASYRFMRYAYGRAADAVTHMKRVNRLRQNRIGSGMPMDVPLGDRLDEAESSVIEAVNALADAIERPEDYSDG